MSCVLSVIIPVYNLERYLEDCFRSIEMQSYRDYEVILVDDGSTDRSPGICDAYAERDPRVRVIHTQNGGVSHARNTGLDEARGSYIYFVDGDDILADRHVWRDMMKFTEDPEVDLVAGRGDEFQDGCLPRDRRTDTFASRVTTSEEDVRRFIADNLLMINVFSRRLIGEERFDPRIALGEDLLFLSCINLRVRRAVLLERICYHRRLRPESASHSTYQEGYFEENRLFFELAQKTMHGRPGGDELLEKYRADQTGLINKLYGVHWKYPGAKRIVRRRIRACFPQFLRNRYIHRMTKVYLVLFMLSPNGFYLLFTPYRFLKRICVRLGDRKRRGRTAGRKD